MQLNAIDMEVQFTLTYSMTEIRFLDTRVYKCGGRLGTDLYVRRTDRNNVLYYQGNHPRKMVDSLPWTQLLRVRRIVCEEENVDV